jgi:Respiratory burst NADPH oxidase
MEISPSKDYVEIPLGDAPPPKTAGIASMSAVQKFVKTMTKKMSSKEGLKTAGQMIKMKRKQWSARAGLKGLRFMASNGKDGWKAIEKRFDELGVNGLLQKESFGKCIGEDESSVTF